MEKNNLINYTYVNNQRGAILLMAIGLVVVLLVLGLAFITILSTDISTAMNHRKSTIAFYLADAGINYALLMLDEDSSWRTGITMNFNGGQFTVSLVDENKGILLTKSVGTYKGAQRTIKVKVKMGNWPNFKYDAARIGWNTPQKIVSRELQERWYYQTGDDIRSSPAIDRSRVVFGCNDDYVYCIKTGDGSLVWRYRTGGNVISSPAIEGDQVFVGSDDGNFYCLSLTDGSVVWYYRNTSNPRPFQSSPVVVNGVVYVGCNDGRIYAFNIADGSIVTNWPFVVGSNVVIYSSPAIDVDNNTMYIGADNGRIYAIDLTTAQIKTGWPYNTGAAVKSTPCIASGYIYCASTNGSVYCFRTDGTVRWQAGQWPWGFGYIQSSPTYSPNENLIFIGAGNRRYYSFNANSGNIDSWYNTTRAVDSTGAVQEDQVFVGNDDDYTVALNTWNLNRRFRYNCRGDVNSSPAIYGNNLYVGADSNRLYKFSSELTPTGTITIVENSWRDTF